MRQSIVDLLIIEDDPDFRTLLAKLVGNEYKIDQAASLKEALARIYQKFYYVALIDKSLVHNDATDTGGIQALAALTQLKEGTRSLVFTNYGDLKSQRVAVEELHAITYREKDDFDDLEKMLKIKTQIYQMIAESRNDYLKRYGSGIQQLTMEQPEGEARVKWTSEVLEVLSSSGGGGYDNFSHFCDLLLRDLPPLLPPRLGRAVNIDAHSKRVEAVYWSKGQGESIHITIGNKNDISVEKPTLNPEKVIREVEVKSFAGVVQKGGLPFENFAEVIALPPKGIQDE